MATVWCPVCFEHHDLEEIHIVNSFTDNTERIVLEFFCPYGSTHSKSHVFGNWLTESTAS